MKIDFFCSPESGSSSFTFLPPDIYGHGVGGAEISLIRLAKALAEHGHDVTVWNKPEPRSQVSDPDAIIGSAYDTDYYDGVRYLDADDYDPQDYTDIFILYRNPYSCLGCVNSKLKIFWSTDQQTCGFYDKDIIPFVDFTVTISPYHRQYHIDRYGVDPNKIISIDLGVDTEEYEQPVQKVPNRLLYASVPSRGLEYLPALFYWIQEVGAHLTPKPELYITSDFSLWGKDITSGNERYRRMFEGIDNVHFVGKLPRAELVKLQLSSDILAYPNAPDGPFAELFGVTLAESQVAGCIPVTSGFGAFPTTVISPPGVLIENDGRYLHPMDDGYGEIFVNTIVSLLSHREELVAQQNRLAQMAGERFNYHTIVWQWLNAIYAHK